MENGWDLDLDAGPPSEAWLHPGPENEHDIGEPDFASLDWFADPKVLGCPDGIADCPIKHALEDRESDKG